MSLRIRRGTNSERLTKTFDQGELAWTTDTEKLYVGDGVTLGGKNIIQSSAGTGFTFNSTTQALEFTIPALNLTTSLVPDSVTTNYLSTGSSGTTFKVISTAGIQPGMLIIASSFLSSQTVTVVVDSQTLTISAAPDVTVVNNTAITFRSPNLYFTNSRAGQAVYDAFGRGSNSGIVFAYNPGTNAISATVNTGNLLPSQTGNSGKYLTTDGIGGLTWTNPISGNMLLPSEAGQQGKYLKVDNSSVPAWADLVLDRLTVNAYSTVLDSFGNLTTPGDIKIPAGKDIKRDNGSGTYVSITGGLGSVSADTSPSLGGNLSLATRSITGSGSIGITGNITNTGNAEFTGTIKALGLGANLSLNSYNLTGTGNIEIGGNITLYGNHILTGDLTGVGDISRTGDIDLIGAITASSVSASTISAFTGLGTNLPLNGKDITGTGNIGITGGLTANTFEMRQAITGSVFGYLTSKVHRGTLASPLAVQAGDELGGLVIKGYTNSVTEAQAGIISVIVDPTATVAGGNFVKSIVAIAASTDTGSSEADALTLNSAGVVTSNAFVASKYTQLAVYANDAARTSAIPTPATGMMVFMVAGTTPAVNNKAVIYDGSAWVALH